MTAFCCNQGSLEKHNLWIIASNQMIISVYWIKNGALVLKCAYWWLRQTYWSGWRGKGAREALEKTTWALQWWREHPPTDHPPGPVPLRAHSTCTSQYCTAGGSVVHNVDLHRLRNVLSILKSHAGFTVIGLVTQLLNDSEISAHSVKSINVQTLKSTVKECFTTRSKVIHDPHHHFIHVSGREYLFFPLL